MHPATCFDEGIDRRREVSTPPCHASPLLGHTGLADVEILVAYLCTKHTDATDSIYGPACSLGFWLFREHRLFQFRCQTAAAQKGKQKEKSDSRCACRTPRRLRAESSSSQGQSVGRRCACSPQNKPPAKEAGSEAEADVGSCDWIERCATLASIIYSSRRQRCKTAHTPGVFEAGPMPNTRVLRQIVLKVKATYISVQIPCRLSARSGTRPVAICFDDLDRSWVAAAAALEAAFPALVRRKVVDLREPFNAADQAFLDSGGVILDRGRFQAWGIFLGQDPLHVYFRIVEAIEWRSWDAAWAMRCARKLLQSWTQVQDAVEDHVRAELEEHHERMTWISVGDYAAESVGQVLNAYFHGTPLPRNPYRFLEQCHASEWRHPDSGKVLPTCAKSVILVDLLRKQRPDLSHAKATSVRAAGSAIPIYTVLS